MLKLLRMTASEERESLPNEKQPAAMANSHPPALHSQVADLRIADSQNLANANYSNLPLLWQPAVKDAQRRNGINGGDPYSGEEAVYAGFAYP